MLKKPKVKLLPHEIFEKVQSVRAMKDRVQILQENESFSVKLILQGNFNDWVQFDLPEGAPPFKEDKNPVDKSAGRIERNIKILRLLLKGGKLSRLRKEVKFVQLLESVNVKDANIIIAMKDKQLNKLYPALTPALVKRAFPKLIKDK